MSLEVEFTNCAMNLNILPEKAITGKILLIESKFLEKPQKQIAAREENLSIWYEC